MADTIVIDTTETETVEVVTTGPQGPPGTGEGGDGTFATDIETTTTGNGLIMKSPNGNRWRLTPSNTGLAVFTALSLLMLAQLAPAQVVGIATATSTNNSNSVITDRATTNTLVWSNALSWTDTTNAAITKTNLGLGAAWLNFTDWMTNTNRPILIQTNGTALTGLGVSNEITFGRVVKVRAADSNAIALQIGSWTNDGTGFSTTTLNGSITFHVTNNIVAAPNNAAFSLLRPLAFITNSTNWSVEQLRATSRTNLGLGAEWLTTTNSTNIGEILTIGNNGGSPLPQWQQLAAVKFLKDVADEAYTNAADTTNALFLNSAFGGWKIYSPDNFLIGLGLPSGITNWAGDTAAATLTNLFTNSNGIPAFGATSNSTYTVVGGQGAWVAPRSVTKVRTSDFVRTNGSITYSNDDTLAGWTLDASSLYSVTLWIPYTCSTNSGMKGQITVPAMERADANFGGLALESGGQLQITGTTNTIIPIATRTTASAAKNWVGRLFFRTGTNSGTANFQWAPAAGGNGTNTNTTTLHSGATITFTKISD
jgi:hypothetical protein